MEEHGKGYLCIPGLWHDGQIEGNRRLTDAVHQYGSKILCQIYHPGKQSTRLVNGNVTPLAPSAIKDPLCQTQPREITIDEIHSLVRQFGDAAARAKAAGFDGVEIHAGHGYLIAEFIAEASFFPVTVLEMQDEILKEMAFQNKAYNPLQETAERLCGEVYTIGSAVRAGNALIAIHDGYEAALKL